VLLHGISDARAAVQVLSDSPTPAVFGNGQRTVRIQFHNPAAQPAEVNLRFRLYQAGGSTMMPLGEAQAWKSITLPAGQTLMGSLALQLPAVRGETAFHVVWFDGESKLGAARISAFPEQLLKPLSGLAGEAPLGLLDPEGQIKAALGSVPADELKQAEDVAASQARLILIAPLSADKRPAGLAAAVKKKAASGTAVVWIQPPTSRGPEPVPDAYVVAEGAGHIVIAVATTISGLPDSPRAQLNLLRLAELATGKKRLELPADPQP